MRNMSHLVLIVGGLLIIGAILYYSKPVVLAPSGDSNANYYTSEVGINANARVANSNDNTPFKNNSNNNSTPAVTSLKIEDTQVGTGPAVKSGDTIRIHYTGTLLDGTKFDSSYDRNQPYETQIGVGTVIKGWDEGILGLRVGGKRTLFIPSNMAYGELGSPPDIPPNTPLKFEVELVEIK